MIVLLRRLIFGCLGRHDDYRERDHAGKLELVCAVCGRRIPTFASPLVKGPCHAQGEVLGRPIGKVKKLGRQLPENVTPIRQVK
jgi:hypothetical protein